MKEYLFLHWIIRKENRLAWINEADKYEFRDTIIITTNELVNDVIAMIDQIIEDNDDKEL